MNLTLDGGARRGCVRASASKSQGHRLLLCAALGRRPVRISCATVGADLHATIRCLQALGARIDRTEAGTLCVVPTEEIPREECVLPCGESAATLRLLLPLVGALGARATFLREGRLPLRPLAPLDAELIRHGMTLRAEGAALHCAGALQAGAFAIAGNVSSQYVSGLLFALPRLSGESTLRVTGVLESAPYVGMTEQTLRLAGVRMQKDDGGYRIPGGQQFDLPQCLAVEGDWTNAACFLCMGALSTRGVRVEGLDLHSAQGDRAILAYLRAFGAAVEERADAVCVRGGDLHACRIDAAETPDLVPALSVLAAAAQGETHVVNAARLRFKESDRLRTTADMLRALGAQVTETADGLVICGGALHGGTVRSENDHRIAMAAAVAACAARDGVRVLHAECVGKSYPDFWMDFARLQAE